MMAKWYPKRSRLFSLSLGLLFTGIAIGPTFGSLLIRFTGKTLSVFFAATTVHIVYTFFLWFILPESLSKKQMENTKSKYAVGLLETANEREQSPAVGLLGKLRRTFAFLSPLTIFMPEEQKDILNPLKKLKMDWNLTLMALGYAFTYSLLVCCQKSTCLSRFITCRKGSYSYKFQYAASAFGWDSQMVCTPPPCTATSSRRSRRSDIG
jgi:MFS family permease